MGACGYHLKVSESGAIFSRIRRAGCLFLSLLTSLLLPFAEHACADIVQYTDEQGVIHFSNVSSPKKTGRGVKVTREASNKRSDGQNVVASRRTASSTSTYSGQPVPDVYSEIISKACDRHGVDPLLVQAIVRVESDFNPFALSSKGAMGLMQLMPQTASDMNIRNTFNPHENIDGGVRYLRYLIDQYAGNLSLALAAYNSGETAVRKWGTVPPFPETQNYVKKILTLYNGSGTTTSRPASYTIFVNYGQDGVLLLTDNPSRSGSGISRKNRNNL